MKYIQLSFIVILLLVLAQFILSNYHLLHSISYDFHLFYIAGQKALQHQNPYLKYAGDWAPYTPPVIVFFALLALIPIHVSQAVFFILSFLAWIIASYFIFRILQKANLLHLTRQQFTLAVLIYTILTIIYFPFRFTLGMGQVGIFLLLFLTLTYYYIQLRKRKIASLFLAGGILLKISPLIFLLLLIVQKQYKVVLFTIIWTIGLFGLSALVLGPSIINQYLSIPSHFLNFTNSIYYNQAFSGLLLRLGFSAKITQYIDIAVALILLGLLGIIISKIKSFNKHQELLLWNIALIFMLIFAPYAWQHHFVLLIFPFITTFFILRSQKASVYFYGFLLISYALTALNIKNPEGLHNSGFLEAIILSHVFWGAAILISLNGYLLLENSKRYTTSTENSEFINQNRSSSKTFSKRKKLINQGAITKLRRT